MARRKATGDYEADRFDHADELLARLPAETAKMTWPLERLHALRDERLRALVRTAKERSPWHARRLRDVDPDALTGDDLSAIPPMTKHDLMANWDEIVTDRRLTLDMARRHLAHVYERGPAYLLDEYHVVTTGGASGVFVWDWDGWLQVALNSWRHTMWLSEHLGLKVPGGPRTAHLQAQAATHMSEAMRRTFEPYGWGRLVPVNLPMSEIVARLNEYQPTSLAGYPSVIHRLALEQLAGRLRISPALVSGGAEPMTEEARATFAKAFDVPVVDPYGTSENWVMAVAPPGGRAMHLVEDTAVYEPVDAERRLVRPGERASSLLLTNVVNHVMPFIRYELTDEVTLLGASAGASPAPWTGRLVANPEGRRDDLFLYPEGVVAHPYVFWTALGNAWEVWEYQVRQTARGADVDVSIVGDFPLEPARRKIVTSLERLGLASPQVSIRVVDAIPRLPGSGKLKRFVPLES